MKAGEESNFPKLTVQDALQSYLSVSLVLLDIPWVSMMVQAGQQGVFDSSFANCPSLLCSPCFLSFKTGYLEYIFSPHTKLLDLNFLRLECKTYDLVVNGAL